MAKLSDDVARFKNEHGLASDDLWEVRPGTWAVKHKALERIASAKGIDFDTPEILAIDLKEKMVAVSITGSLVIDGKKRIEWSTGEAAPYNNKNGYPVAMAEKRARDRVVLKLLNAHGDFYSEAEADEFAGSGKHFTLPKKDAKEIYTKMQNEIRETQSRDQLKLWGESNRDRIKVLPEDWQDILRLQYEEMMADLRQQEAA